MGACLGAERQTNQANRGKRRLRTLRGIVRKVFKTYWRIWVDGRWCASKEVDHDFNKLRQLILLEEFKSCLSSHMKTYLDERIFTKQLSLQKIIHWPTDTFPVVLRIVVLGWRVHTVMEHLVLLVLGHQTAKVSMRVTSQVGQMYQCVLIVRRKAMSWLNAGISESMSSPIPWLYLTFGCQQDISQDTDTILLTKA